MSKDKHWTKNLILHLHHETYPHEEKWYETTEIDVLHVISTSPFNYPRKGEHDVHILQAMRQFILMTSPEEGWHVYEDHGWRSMIDRLELEPIIIIAKDLDDPLITEFS